MNFNPACAASQRLPQPGHRGVTGLGEDEAGWGRTNCELPLPESRRRRGRRDPWRLQSGKPRRAGHGCRDAAPPAPARLHALRVALSAEGSSPPRQSSRLAPRHRSHGVHLVRPRAAARAPAA